MTLHNIREKCDGNLCMSIPLYNVKKANPSHHIYHLEQITTSRNGKITVKLSQLRVIINYFTSASTGYRHVGTN